VLDCDPVKLCVLVTVLVRDLLCPVTTVDPATDPPTDPDPATYPATDPDPATDPATDPDPAADPAADPEEATDTKLNVPLNVPLNDKVFEIERAPEIETETEGDNVDVRDFESVGETVCVVTILI